MSVINHDDIVVPYVSEEAEITKDRFETTIYIDDNIDLGLLS